MFTPKRKLASLLAYLQFFLFFCNGILSQRGIILGTKCIILPEVKSQTGFFLFCFVLLQHALPLGEENDISRLSCIMFVCPVGGKGKSKNRQINKWGVETGICGLVCCTTKLQSTYRLSWWGAKTHYNAILRLD